jgi:hypothetical protein
MPETENWFRQRRDELRMSQTDVVIAFLPARITAGAVSGWERGQVPSLDWADDIARVYQVSVRKVLEVMHEMARARTAEAAGAAKE